MAKTKNFVKKQPKMNDLLCILFQNLKWVTALRVVKKIHFYFKFCLLMSFVSHIQTNKIQIRKSKMRTTYYTLLCVVLLLLVSSAASLLTFNSYLSIWILKILIWQTCILPYLQWGIRFCGSLRGPQRPPSEMKEEVISDPMLLYSIYFILQGSHEKKISTFQQDLRVLMLN